MQARGKTDKRAIGDARVVKQSERLFRLATGAFFFFLNLIAQT